MYCIHLKISNPVASLLCMNPIRIPATLHDPPPPKMQVDEIDTDHTSSIDLVEFCFFLVFK